MMNCSVEINTFIDLFSYNPISTLLNLIKYKKITQIQISNYIQINERNTRNYFLRKTKKNNFYYILVVYYNYYSKYHYNY